MRELRRVAPGASPIRERNVPPQQVVDVTRRGRNFAQEQRGERHDEEPLEDVGTPSSSPGAASAPANQHETPAAMALSRIAGGPGAGVSGGRPAPVARPKAGL